MLDDPRTKARSFLESSSIVSELEDVLNHLVYEKPDDLHGFLANYFLDQCKQPQIASLTLRRLMGPSSEPSIHIDLTVSLRNRTERHRGLTVNLLSNKLNAQLVNQLEALVGSTKLKNILNRVNLFDQTNIDELLANFRSEHANEMMKLVAIEVENTNVEATPETSSLKVPSSKRAPPSPAAGKSSTVPPPSKKGTGKDTQPIEIIPDEPEPFSFAGQILITGISLTCRLITAEIQQINFYRLIQPSSLSNLSMPLPIIPILQHGLNYPGKQAIIKYLMLIPTPRIVHNEEWMHKVHNIIQVLRDTLLATKGATLQSTYSTDDGCLVFPMDKPEQGLDILQTAVNNVCGSDEHWFDYAVQMAPYETFDYTRGKYEIATGSIKSADELADVYTELLDAYPRCTMLIDPFRYADKSSLSRLNDRLSHRCYITSTDTRRYQDPDDKNSINCHLLNFDNAPTLTEFIQRVNTFRENNSAPLGLYEREHQEIAQAHLADLSVALGFRFLKLPGILSQGGQLTSAILQRLSLIRDEIELSNDEQYAHPKAHEFIAIRTTTDSLEQERIPSDNPTTNKSKDKKKRT